MDIYLPADFYALRDDLNDWRDSGTSADTGKSADSAIDSSHKAMADRGEADPNWRVL
jgi:hypothetical protein